MENDTKDKDSKNPWPALVLAGDSISQDSLISGMSRESMHLVRVEEAMNIDGEGGDGGYAKE